MKLDTGKAPVRRGFVEYFPRAIKAVAMISQFGFDKYGEWGGWKKVEDAYNRYNDALGRHDADMAIETHCSESKHMHIAHRAWNAMATLELLLIEQEKLKTQTAFVLDEKLFHDVEEVARWRDEVHKAMSADWANAKLRPNCICNTPTACLDAGVCRKNPEDATHE
jgi:hypothetical protein